GRRAVKPARNRANEARSFTSMNDSTRTRWTGLGGLGAIVVGVGVYYLFLRTPEATPLPPIPKANPPIGVDHTSENLMIPDVRFVDITREAGIRFTHTNGSFGLKLLPETMGPGCAFFDFDNDGHQDILIVNSRYWADEPDRDKKPTP